ncbi:MAG: FAD-dependent oxidoreductase [Candidatus Uhrbacteria bacterium]|nr:FAD-dependent oxidoreductase [Candidatus Uhrbacteria bacterium]
MSTQTIILGGGIAGTTAAEELRKLEPEAEITIIEQEEHPCYSRVLLPHYLKGVVPREKVFLKSLAWYAAQRIELMTGTRVEAIDVVNHFVRTNDDRELPFDRLLLATGGELNLASEDMRGVVYLRSVDDADQIVGLMREVTMKPLGERFGVVYGGGFMALEFINLFAHAKIHTTVLMRGAGFWSSTLSPESQACLRRHAESRGVVICTEEPMPSLRGERELEAVVGKSGEYRADILGVGIGIHAEAEVFTRAGIATQEGILVNEYLETSHPGVFAAGDVAEFFDVHVGRQLVYGNWMNAQMQGRAVAKVMHGERAPFSLVSSYATNLLGMQVVFVGDADRKAADRIEVAETTNGGVGELFYRQDKLVGAVLLGDIAKRMAITAEIRG